MISPKYQRYAERLRAMIDEGTALLGKVVDSGRIPPHVDDSTALHEWIVKIENLVKLVFGSNSVQYKHLTAGKIYYGSDVRRVIGTLRGALSDLENGFLQGQEFIVASEVFDSVLEQAKHLNGNGYKDPAAILARVVLEDALKRLARENSIDSTQKATKINSDLRQAGIYPIQQERLVQARLDIGNAAAHGKFNEYTAEDVNRKLKT